ncbi:MAG: ATP-binding protein [Bdellovibrionaceae bacterium]|nr:ATP-binding protein [Pseudobdellovibrionaceae bacterium]
MSEVFRIFENMQDVALVIDGQGQVHYGNSAAGILLDVTSRRLSVGKPLSNFVEFSPGLIEDQSRIHEVDEPTQTREIEFTTGSGKQGWAQVSLQAFPEPLQAAIGGEASRLWIVYLRDVTLEKTLHSKYKAELDQKEAVIEDLRKAQAELENYSKNLERMVEERTRELHEANRLLATILDSLGQGIFVFDGQGQCLPVFSKVCEALFDMVPAGKNVADVLRLQGTERETFMKWTDAVFAEMLAFEDLVGLGPSKFTRGDRHIALDFHPLRGDAQDLRGLVLVATDKTEEVKARQEAERERSVARRIVQILQHRNQFRMFAGEAERLSQELLKSLEEARPSMDVEEFARHLHTIKGGAASFSLLDIAEVAHDCEDILSEWKNQRTSAPGFTDWPADLRAHLRVRVERLRTILAEFLSNHAFLVGGANGGGRVSEVPVTTLIDWQGRLHDLSPQAATRVADEILHSWVLEPAAKSFAHLDEPLQELASSLGKSIKKVAVSGGDVRIWPEGYKDLFGTFIHAFRNAVDHGLEAPEERVAAGKDRAGRLELDFEMRDDGGVRRLKVEIRDDGRGIDPRRIRDRLEQKGLSFDRSASDDDVIQAVFRDDFSTASAVTSVSGRGVGLSAIQSQAEKMGGRAFVRSRVGQGSVLTVIVPDPGLGVDLVPAPLKKTG